MQLICDLERIECDLQMQYFTTRKQIQIIDFFNVSTVPTLYVLCFVIASLHYNNNLSSPFDSAITKVNWVYTECF